MLGGHTTCDDRGNRCRKRDEGSGLGPGALSAEHGDDLMTSVKSRCMEDFDAGSCGVTEIPWRSSSEDGPWQTFLSR
jgi:hypothetical protein